MLGYYQILASDVRKTELKNFLFTLRICEPSDLERVDFLSRAVDNCRTFWHESDTQIKRAAKKAHEEASKFGGSVTFVRSGFKPSEGLFGARSVLFQLGQADSQFDDRVVPCTKALQKRRSGFHCYFASVGHPSASGVIRSVKNLTALVK